MFTTSQGTALPNTGESHSMDGDLPPLSIFLAHLKVFIKKTNFEINNQISNYDS